jgi:hypothetical protein
MISIHVQASTYYLINTLKQHYKLYLVGDVTSFDTFLVDMRDKYNSNMKM